MKNPNKLENLVDAFQSVKGFKTMLRGVCRDACYAPESSGSRDEFKWFSYNGKDYMLRISRDHSWRDLFYISLEDEDDLLDEIELGRFGSIKDAYEYITWLLGDMAKEEAEKISN